MGDALWFDVGEDLDRFSINEFCLITGMKCVGSTHLALAVDNRLMRRYFLTLRGVSREHLKLQLSNAKFGNDNDDVKLGLLYMIFCIRFANANSATRAAICNTVENRLSSKRKPLKKSDKVHYSIAGFPHALLVCVYESIPTIAGKFTIKYVEAIMRMLSWTSADNVKFDDMMSDLTAVGEKHPKCFVMVPTDEELKGPSAAQIYLKNPTVMPQPPRKTHVPQPSTETNSEWREVLELLYNLNDNVEGNPTIAYHVSSRHKRNVQTDDSEALKTDSDDLDSALKMMYSSTLTSVSLRIREKYKEYQEGEEREAKENEEENFENDKGKKKETKPDTTKKKEEEKEDEEAKGEEEERKNEKAANEQDESISDVKMSRLSRLGQQRSEPMVEIGSPSHAPMKPNYAFPPGLSDEPPRKKLEEFREYIKKGLLKRPPHE
ncbi:hypothetical protein TIFTF001_017126 [Ficus carica]|uniref:DUF1985 domain-containing protein n=1 Tax=Ficus carica TaxID=3494 RepID=A0AA88DAF6_FICCA|nr:hypothetical protein TIFTF001_017126 [Ficus carica]